MNRVDFKLDIKGLRELMKSAEMQQILKETVADVANKASMQTGGDEFGTAIVMGSYVAMGRVFPDSGSAVRAVYQDNVLEKSLNGLPRSKGSG